jgi:cell division septum initiation protein DivIVA
MNNIDHIDQLKEQLEDNLKRILTKKRVLKSEVISLKRQAKTLASYDEKFNSLLSKITTQVNGMKGELNEDRRSKLQLLIKEYFESN